MIIFKIKPVDDVRESHKQGQLNDVTKDQINKILGFIPNSTGDEDKVTAEWLFTVNGKECSIWDYKGSAEYDTFSFCGPREIGEALFGIRFQPLYYR